MGVNTWDCGGVSVQLRSTCQGRTYTLPGHLLIQYEVGPQDWTDGSGKSGKSDLVKENSHYLQDNVYEWDKSDVAAG